MSSSTMTVEQKREQRRQVMLEGNLLKVIPGIALPRRRNDHKCPGNPTSAEERCPASCHQGWCGERCKVHRDRR